MIKTRLLGLAFLALAGSAAAAELPRFNVEAYCERVASGSHDSFNYCIAEEQSAYDDLRGRAASVSDQTMDYCSRVAGNSYDSLQYCIEEESDAEENRRSFIFD
ncbi:hypothetical protein [Vreelandella sp. TE19]